MVITKETKKRFVEMLLKKQVIVIRNKKEKSRYYDYKFIGANSTGRWDFTPMVAELSDCKVNYPNDVQMMSIHTFDGIGVVCSILECLKKEGIESFEESGDDLYFAVRDKLVFFYFS